MNNNYTEKQNVTSFQLIKSSVVGSSTSFHNLAKKAGTLDPESPTECISQFNLIL
jgi:hypothetical protein